jgi:hypothetical protein
VDEYKVQQFVLLIYIAKQWLTSFRMNFHLSCLGYIAALSLGN